MKNKVNMKRIWCIYAILCIIVITVMGLCFWHEVKTVEKIAASDPKCYEVVDKYYDLGVFRSHCYLFLRDLETNEVFKVEHTELYYWVDVRDKVYAHVYKNKVIGCDYRKGDLPNIIYYEQKRR